MSNNTSQLSLAERAAVRMAWFDKVMSKYSKAMQQFAKMLIKDKDPQNPKQAIYPHLLNQISQELVSGTLDYIHATRTLVDDYSEFSQDKKFVKSYQDRMDYLELIQEELSDGFKDLSKALAEDTVYHPGLERGQKKLSELFTQLNGAKKRMFLAKETVEQSVLEASRVTTTQSRAQLA